MIRAAGDAALSSSLVKSDLVPIATGYVLVMGALAIGLLILRRRGPQPVGVPEPGAPGGWLRFVRHVAELFAGGYLVLMAVIIAYYFGLVRVSGDFIESGFSGCAELLGISAPLFLAASWLDTRRAPRGRGTSAGAKHHRSLGIKKTARPGTMGGMATHVALLRGINVGGRNKVAMPALREVVSSLGHAGVSTYIQSGNVLFSTAHTDAAALAEALEGAIEGAFGIAVSVVVLSGDELAAILRGNPYPDEPDPRRVHVVFLNAEPPRDLLDRIAKAQEAAAAKGSRDTITAAGRVLYLHTPDGYGNSELAQTLFRIAGPKGKATARNWATATKLLALCEDKG
jgi:uncharacterized protein (DUF1697 family)